MFTNILIGVDGRQGGRDAIELGRQLAGSQPRFTLAHVYGLLIGRGAVQALPIERAESKQLLERERELAALDANLMVSCAGLVGQGLHELAEDQDADLLVVGSTRHALLGRVLLGDNCRAAFDGVPCAIAIAPRGYVQAARPLRRIGVGYDGSPESQRALSAARELASATGGEVCAYRIVSLQDVREEKPIPADWPREIDHLVARDTEQLAQLEGVHGVVRYGGPREELVQSGKDLDLLIVGSRRYGPFGRMFHGSVSRYLVRHSSCPLLVLPRARVREAETAQDDGATHSTIAAVG